MIRSATPATRVFDYHSLDGHPFLVMKEGQELRHSFFSLVEALDISPTVALETTDMATAQTLAGIGVGAAIVPGGLAVANTPAVEPKYFSCGLFGRLGRRPGL